MPVSFLLKIHSSRSNSRSRRLRVVVRDIVVTAQHQTVQIEPSKATSFRLSTEGLGDVVFPRASLSNGLQERCQ